MLDSCGKHPSEIGVALCRRCGDSWCSSCIVYSFGPKKPPFCLSCAMVAGGVRTSATLPAMPRRMMKARMKARMAEAKAAATVATGSDQEPATTDWSTPWWEDSQSTMAE